MLQSQDVANLHLRRPLAGGDQLASQDLQWKVQIEDHSSNSSLAPTSIVGGPSTPGPLPPVRQFSGTYTSKAQLVGLESFQIPGPLHFEEATACICSTNNENIEEAPQSPRLNVVEDTFPVHNEVLPHSAWFSNMPTTDHRRDGGPDRTAADTAVVFSLAPIRYVCGIFSAKATFVCPHMIVTQFKRLHWYT